MSEEELVEVNTSSSSSSEDEVVEVNSESEEDDEDMAEEEPVPESAATADSPIKGEASHKNDGEKATQEVSTPTQDKGTADSNDKSASKKTPKSSTSKKASTPAGTPARKKSGKPTYLDMVHDAIVALKDRTGSSAPAINKWILAEFDHTKSLAPNSFKNFVNSAIKQGVKEERFVKVKSSYKVNAAWTKKQKAAEKAKQADKKRREMKRKKEAEKARLEKKKQEDQAKKKAELEKKKAELEKKKKEAELTPEQKAAQEEKRKKKEAAEARAKYIAERLRKRRFPMEDTKLHAEDKELGVKPPDDVTKRPTLPHTLGCIVPPHQREDGRKSSVVVNASSCGNGHWLGSDDTRGLITDALHVYHFFCGDVGFADDNYPVPKFSVKTMFYALDEILNGNAKAAKSLPPLITHLFTTALRILTSPISTDEDAKKAKDEDGMEAVQARLEKDLLKLQEGLNPVSWSQICLFYMDLMERYYTSDVSLERGVLAGENKLDMSYMWEGDKIEEDETALTATTSESMEDGPKNLPKNYRAYLGDTNGAVARGYTKLQKQFDPWNLTAEELMALLRALVDDIISQRRDLGEDIAGRSAKLNELQKAKNSAFYKYRKVKLAYEGPKKPTKPKKAESSEGKEGDESGPKEVGEKVPEEAPFVPTATKQQLQAAEKALTKATEAFDNGLKKLISRSDPIGVDRYFNAYYFFPTDPEMLHVEELKTSSLPPELKNLDLTLNPNSSWRYIDTKSLFEQFLGGLDIRGIRENELYNYCSGLTILKRRLLDENKDKGRAAARARDKEDMERRVENARSACADDGRRSGRLAGMAQEELDKVLNEAEMMEKQHAAEERQEQEAVKRAYDYTVLTGLEMLKELDAKRDEDVTSFANISCHRLWDDKEAAGNGTIQVLIESLLTIEERIDQIAPLKSNDTKREVWRAQLVDASKLWVNLCSMKLGPSSQDETEDESTGKENVTSMNDETIQKAKKQKLGQPPSNTIHEKSCISSIINIVKKCVIDLELRMFEMTGIKAATEAADAVDDAGSSSDEDDGDEKGLKCWKRKINALKQVPTPRYVLIRDIIIAAITVARKAHHNQVAAELKKALQLYRPSAAGEAKTAAIAVLESYGGYDGMESDEIIDFDEIVEVDAGDQKLDDAAEAVIESMICDEVSMMGGSLGGEENADRRDWFDALKSCKSIARLATVVQFFLTKADGILNRIREEKDVLDILLGVGSKSRKSRTSKKKYDSSTPVWCDATITNKIVKGKVNGFPWWPARVCNPNDAKVAEALSHEGSTLISFVGEPSMYIVKDTEVRDFEEDIEQDLTQWDRNTTENLNESTKMARKLWRTQNRGTVSPWAKKSKPRFIEEKKTAH